MKLTEKEARDARIDALADVMLEYRVCLVPGDGGAAAAPYPGLLG